nr:E1 protein [Equus caballus papillomavirus 2]
MDTDNDPGTSPREGTSGAACFLDREALCSDCDSDDLEDSSEGIDGADFVDNAFVGQGNSLALFQQQQARETEEQIQQLKRKYARTSLHSPVRSDSPQLTAFSLASGSPQVKRRLFEPPQPGSGGRPGVSYEAHGFYSRTDLQVETPLGIQGGRVPLRSIENVVDSHAGTQHLDVLRASNREAAMLGRFKTCFEVGFNELTRPFTSNKTCAKQWVVLAYSVREALFEAAKELLRQHCDYAHMTLRPDARGPIVLLLLSFRAQKNRDTVHKLLQGMLNVNTLHLLSNPPRMRSVVVGLFWYRLSLSNMTTVFGPTPDWLKRLTLLQHQCEEAMKFEFSDMVQWAYDNHVTEESQIAYGYASLADTNANAAAFLACASQAKYVRDVATMVKYYRRAEMQNMSISEWIHRQAERIEGEGDWRPIINFLKHQGVEISVFINNLKHFVKGVPKKNCMVLVGPPNTGKSSFAVSLLEFMNGKVLFFPNSKSHFWLMPLADTRMALLDDATGPVWDFFDHYMRNAMDGNPISVDQKHKQPLQLRCPPLLMTTNVDISQESKYWYLHSRMIVLRFPNPFPLDENQQPVFELTVKNWKSLFKRLWQRLELSDQEDEGDDGEPTQGFRCTGRKTNDFV